MFTWLYSSCYSKKKKKEEKKVIVSTYMKKPITSSKLGKVNLVQINFVPRP